MIFKLAQAAEKHWRRLDGQNQLPKVILGVCFIAQAAEKHWRRLDGQNQLPKVILGVCFTDGIEVAKEEAHRLIATRSPLLNH
jgi:hypothetical protein